MTEFHRPTVYQDRDWMKQALCSPETQHFFFPERDGDQRFAVKEARALCDACPVAAPCLEFALNDPSLQGIWGGQTQRQRERIRRQREDFAGILNFCQHCQSTFRGRTRKQLCPSCEAAGHKTWIDHCSPCYQRLAAYDPDWAEPLGSARRKKAKA